MTWPAEAGSVRTGAGDRSNALDPEFREFDGPGPCRPTGGGRGSSRRVLSAGLRRGVGRWRQPADDAKPFRRHPSHNLHSPPHVVSKVGAGEPVNLAPFL